MSESLLCLKCGATKPYDEFKRKSAGGPRGSPCLKCVSDYGKKYHQTASGKESIRRQADRRKQTPRTEHRREFETQLRWKYGIELEDVARAFEAQEGMCGGCYCRLVFDSETHADHHHASGIFRGLLCSHCNKAVGLVRDSPSTLRQLADYLERSNAHAYEPPGFEDFAHDFIEGDDG